jgi:hypothetical protein
MLNSTSWNIGAKANFVYGPLAGIMAIWSYFRLPEMKVSLVNTGESTVNETDQTRTDPTTSSTFCLNSAFLLETLARPLSRRMPRAYQRSEGSEDGGVSVVIREE